MKSKGRIILKAGMIFVFFITLGTCQSFPGVISDPGISFDSVVIKGISFTGVDMIANIRIKNDNPITIPFPAIEWKLFVSNVSFLSGKINKDTKLPARDSTMVELPFTVGYEGLYRTVTALLTASDAPYRVEVAATFSIPVLGDKTFTASHSGTFPLRRLLGSL
ncbi:MAG: LEA type 2 family protein [Treponema sp.]|jgi:LEA14-like dessication related protein|nr:LEA type 2 family protein [Treponema sp.]